jgi:nucleoside-diphosphate-sugar epimerase
LGSITEYGSDIIHITENLTPRPETFYEVFKLNNLNIVNQALSEGWLANSIYLRLGNVYGFQNSDEFSQRNFIDKSVRRVLNNENLVCYGDGSYLRDYLHIDDLTNLLIEIIENLQLEGSNIFNIGNYQSTTIYEALRIMANTSLRLHNFLPEIILTDFPSNSYKLEKRSHVISPSKILHISNWRPTIDLQTGLSLSMLNTNQDLK